MSPTCPHCGILLRDPQVSVCPRCGMSLAARPGWLRRLLGVFRGAGGSGAAGSITDRQTHRVDVVHSDKQVYHSLEEMPPELRAQVQAMMGTGKAASSEYRQTTVNGVTTFIHRDAQGREHRYQRLEEMPAEIRQVFERFRAGHP